MTLARRRPSLMRDGLVPSAAWEEDSLRKNSLPAPALYLRPGGGRYPGPYQVGGHQSGATYRLAAFSRSMQSAISAVPGWKP